VVVVCNGCTDQTATVARSVAGVEVVEIAEASKIAALRAGDDRARTFPRIYLDADIELSGQAALALARALEVDQPRAAGVRADVDLSGASSAVRRFYAFRQRLPVFQDGIIGAGVYAMNRAGRDRFGPWPEVLGDDLYVLRLFGPDERVTVDDHRSRVVAPPDLATLIRRGVRVRRGNTQPSHGVLDAPAMPRPPSGVGAALRETLSQPSAWPAALTWLGVSLWIRLLARTRPGGGDWAGAGRHRTAPPEAR
jgi:hypothetical protein